MKTHTNHILASLLATGFLATLIASSQAAKFSSAEVSKKVNLVELLLPDGNKRSAEIGSTVSGSTAVQTGNRSRTQLSFPDESVIRLGSNSVFSFTSGERDVKLDQGTMLMQSKRFRGRTRIRTAAVTAAITGTTILLEFIPPVLNAAGKVIKAGIIKIIVVEGSLEFALNINPGKKMQLGAGEMVVLSSDAKQLPKKFIIDLGRLTKTSKLMEGGLGRLPKQDQINRAIAVQQREKASAQLVSVATRETSFVARRQETSNARNARNAVNARPPMRIVQTIFRQPRVDSGPAKKSSPPPPQPPPVDRCVDISGPPPPECVNRPNP